MQFEKRVAISLFCIGSLLLTGCASIGPSNVVRDRFDYVAAISESWKRQMLQNLLKIRYTDAPVFMDVTSVIFEPDEGSQSECKHQKAVRACSTVPGTFLLFWAGRSSSFCVGRA